MSTLQLKSRSNNKVLKTLRGSLHLQSRQWLKITWTL